MSILLNKIIKSRNTIIDMLELRNFNLDKYKELSSNELGIMLDNMEKSKSYELMPLDIECYSNDTGEEKKKCIVKYLKSKIRTTFLQQLIDNMFENQLIKENDTLIFIIGVKVPNIDQYYSQLDNYLVDKKKK